MSKKPSSTPEHDLDDRVENYLGGKPVERFSVQPDDQNSPELLETEEFELVEEGEGVAELEAELDIELAGMAGKIIESKPLDSNLLAKIEIEKNNLGYREGIRLILKIQGRASLIFGNKHADKLDPKTIDISYAAITSTEQFLEMDGEYREGIDMEQKRRLEKLKKELFTIGGIIKKFRFLGHNLLALVKIDKGFQEAAFAGEKTDPKRLQMALIQKGERIDCIEGLRDGIYTVLSKGEAGMKVLGGKNASLLDPEIAETIYESIQNPAHFFDADSKLKEYIKGLQEDVDKEIELKTRELEKIMRELDGPITIEGEGDEVAKIPEGELDEELDKLTDEINELENGKKDD